MKKVKDILNYHYWLNDVLGSGSFATVYLGTNDKTRQKVAIKIIKKNMRKNDFDDYQRASLFNQIKLLQKINDQNVVKFIDAMHSNRNYYIIMEACQQSLKDKIKSKEQITEAQAIEILRQICSGYLALFKKGILHRDLKPANILIKGQIYKLTDFGFAKQLNDITEMASSSKGTPLYMSLQVLRREKYTQKCDVWALGLIFYEILHKRTPWTARSPQQLIEAIQSKPLEIRRKDLSQKSKDFLKRCLELKECNRICWNQIFIHPIFSGYFKNKVLSKHLEFKLNRIMNSIRCYVTSNNLNMQRILDSLGFDADKKEIGFQNFYQFLQRVHPEITKEEAQQCFKRIDKDKNNYISIEELKDMLKENGIKLGSQFDIVPAFKQKAGEKQNFQKISMQASKKLTSCFQKLYKIITINKVTLGYLFKKMEKQKKGNIKYPEFKVLIKKLCGSQLQISQDQIQMAYNLVDEDGSNSIQFQELNKYYSKVNGIPIQTNQPQKVLLPSISQRRY